MLAQQGTKMGDVRDVHVTSFHVCDGLELVVDCLAPESLAVEDIEASFLTRYLLMPLLSPVMVRKSKMRRHSISIVSPGTTWYMSCGS